MGEQRTVGVVLEDGTELAVLAEQIGPVLVSDEDVVGKLQGVTSSIERVSREVLDAARRAAPDRATVELGFSLALEQGRLVALVGKGRAEASIVVTLEWGEDE